MAMVAYTLINSIPFTILFSHQFQSNLNKIPKSLIYHNLTDIYSNSTSPPKHQYYSSSYSAPSPLFNSKATNAVATIFLRWKWNRTPSSLSLKNVTRLLHAFLSAQSNTTLNMCRTLQHILTKAPHKKTDPTISLINWTQGEVQMQFRRHQKPMVLLQKILAAL